MRNGLDFIEDFQAKIFYEIWMKMLSILKSRRIEKITMKEIIETTGLSIQLKV
jgi:hypothetical protein